jgi:hypothetical protein
LRILGPKRDEMKGGWNKLRSEDSSPDIIIKVIKSRRIRWGDEKDEMR